MSLLVVKKKFVLSLTVLMVALSGGGALAFQALLPEYYFAWYPSIPVFFYLFGLFYISMFGYCYRVSPQRMIAVYLMAKAAKMMLSILILSVYAVAVGHQVLAFAGTYIIFYVAFLVFETRFFFRFEMKHKSNRYKDK